MTDKERITQLEEMLREAEEDRRMLLKALRGRVVTAEIQKELLAREVDDGK